LITRTFAVALGVALGSSAPLAQTVSSSSSGPRAALGPNPAAVPLAVEVAASGFQFPVLATAPAGDAQRLFVLEQLAGQVRLVKDGVLQPTPFLDLSGQIFASGENGLLSLVFHPDYASNGRLFVYYNEPGGAAVLAEYAAVPPDADVVTGPGTVLLSNPQPFPQHNGGSLHFGPLDGMLYLTTGDGGGAFDPLDLAQDVGSRLGKVLRIDVDAGAPYAIPPDNPFAGVPGAAEEVWALGFRNPWRAGLDPLTGDLWIGDVGQGDREEVDFLPAGASGLNFGWDCLEGTLCVGAGCGCGSPTYTPPVYEYDHNQGCSVLGGPVYRGAAVAGLAGRVFFGDYCTGRVWSLRYENGQVTGLVDHSSELIPPGGGNLGLISSFGTDGLGELLVVSHSLGEVYRIVSAEPQPDCDGDGLPDASEIAQGTAFDANANDVPDDCELLLMVGELHPGQSTTLVFIGAQPGDPVDFYYSERGIGAGPCPFPGLCLDILPMQVGDQQIVPKVGTVDAGPQGVATILFPVPAVPPVTEYAFQAVVSVPSNPKKSNAVLRVVSP